VIVRQDEENIADPPLELLGACNMVSLLKVIGCWQGQIIIQDGLAKGKRRLAQSITGSVDEVWS
jgi:hypothetical protein